MNKKKQKTLKIVLLTAAIIFILLVTYLVGKPMIQFVSEPEKFRIWVQEKGVWGMLAFMGMNILQVLLAVIPGGPFEIGGGYAYGVVLGSILCDISTTIGSVIVLLFVRKFGMKFVELFVSKEQLESTRFLKSSPKMASILFLVFLIPGSPKDPLTYAVGLTDLPVSTWFFINLVGRFPAILLSAMSGSALSSQRYLTAAIVFGVIVLLYVIGLVAYRKIKSVKQVD